MSPAFEEITGWIPSSDDTGVDPKCSLQSDIYIIQSILAHFCRNLDDIRRQIQYNIPPYIDLGEEGIHPPGRDDLGRSLG